MSHVRSHSLVLLLSWALSAVGCGPGQKVEEGLRFSGAGDVVVVADAGAEETTGSPDGGCATNPIELLSINYGETDRYYVEVEHEGTRAALQFDTGSSLTFLFQGQSAPDYTPDVGELRIGCEELRVAGRGFDAPGTTVGDGLPVIGLLGMDFLLGTPTLLDVGAGRLERLPDLPGALPSVYMAFDDVQGHALVHCVLDGQPLRLMFDTGAGHTLWVGVEGKRGDRVVYAEDFEGNVFPIYEGSADMTCTSEAAGPRPVARAPEFPYFEQTVAALGGNLHGLLGVTAFPEKALLISGSEGRIYLVDL